MNVRFGPGPPPPASDDRLYAIHQGLTTVIGIALLILGGLL